MVGARCIVEPPHYQGITVVARIQARRRARTATVEDAARRALYRYFDPIVGGPDGDGWPFGRPVHVGEVYAVLQRVEGVEYVEDVRLFATDPLTGQRGEATQRLGVGPELPRVQPRAPRPGGPVVTFDGRGLMPETATPHPLESLLPGLFLDDPYAW